MKCGRYYSYTTGRQSPYGEQAMALVQSLAAKGGLNVLDYADKFWRTFAGESGDIYRDASCKGFLRNWATGKPPTASGAKDEQANCAVRGAPIVLAYSGSNHDILYNAVEGSTRVTQNSHRTVAWAFTCAKILNGMYLY